MNFEENFLLVLFTRDEILSIRDKFFYKENALIGQAELNSLTQVHIKMTRKTPLQTKSGTKQRETKLGCGWRTRPPHKPTRTAANGHHRETNEGCRNGRKFFCIERCAPQAYTQGFTNAKRQITKH